MKYKISLVAFFLCLCLFLVPLSALAVEGEGVESEGAEDDSLKGGVAVDITKSCTIRAEGFYSTDRLTDGKCAAGAYSYGASGVKITATEPIGSLYIVFNTATEGYKISSGASTRGYGESGFLHEFVDVSADFGETDEITLAFSASRNISEIYVFSEGARPDWVQVWQEPTDRADLLLFSSHSDDDQLYFAGLIPLYVARGYNVQVAYFTYHPDDYVRRHELLCGLWEAGCRNYPIYDLEIPDFRIDDYALTMAEFERRGFSRESIEDYIISVIRRTHPLVLVTHEPEGEYGHGMHIALSALIRETASYSADRTKYPESAKKYGLWEVQKIYLHDYDENKITLPIDTPLDYFGGRTAFGVSQDAFRHHTSQHYYSLTSWLYGSEAYPITRSSQIYTDNPSYFGLFSSRVGDDKNKNDIFENLLSYAEAERSGKAYPTGAGLLAESYESEIAELVSSLEASKAETEAARKKIKELEDTILSLGADSEEARRELEGKLEAELAKVAELESKISVANATLATLKAELELLKSDKNTLEGEREELGGKIEQLRGEADALRASVVVLSVLTAVFALVAIASIAMIAMQSRRRSIRRRSK